MRGCIRFIFFWSFILLSFNISLIQASDLLPTNEEIKRDVGNALTQTPAACGIMGEPKIDRMSIASVVAGDERIVGSVVADISVSNPFNKKRCKSVIFGILERLVAGTFRGLVIKEK